MRIAFIEATSFPSTRHFIRALETQSDLTVEVIRDGERGGRSDGLCAGAEIAWFEGVGRTFWEGAAVLARTGSRIVVRLSAQDLAHLPIIRRLGAVHDIVLPAKAAASPASDDPKARPRIHVVEEGSPEEECRELGRVLCTRPGERDPVTWQAWLALATRLVGRTLLVGKGTGELARFLGISHGIEVDCADPDADAPGAPYGTVVFWDALLTAEDPKGMFERMRGAIESAGRVIVAVPARPLMHVPGKRRRVGPDEIEGRLPRLPCRLQGRTFGDHVIIAGDSPRANTLAPRARRRDERVSVLIVTYNEGERLLRAIGSILGQSVLPGEIVVVDDGSEDDTRRLAKAMDHPLIRYMRIEHGGRAAARNAALRACRGQWIAWLDADDLALPGRLAAQIERMEATGADLVYSDGVRVGETGGAFALRHYRPFTTGEMPRRLFEGLTGVCPILNTSLMIRRSVYDRAGLFDVSWRRCEDYHLFIRLSTLGDVVSEHIDEPLVVVYQPVGGLSLEKCIEEFEHYWRLLDLMVAAHPLERLVSDGGEDLDDEDGRELAVAREKIKLMRHFNCWGYGDALREMRGRLERLAASPSGRIAAGALNLRGVLEANILGPEASRAYFEKAVGLAPANVEAKSNLETIIAGTTV